MNEAGIDEKGRLPNSLPPFPRLWIGFALAGLFFVVELSQVRFVQFDLGNTPNFAPLVAISLIGFFYWLVCVHRLHQILGAMAPGGYPISPGRAAGFHLIPLFNLFWLVRWPNVLANFLKSQGNVRIINGQLLGLMLFLSLILGRVFDGGVGLAGFFGVTTYISGKIRQRLEAGKPISG